MKKMSEKNIKDRIVNSLLLLYLIHRANEKGKIEDPIKSQKLVFFAQKKFIERKLKGFAYNFFRWHMGPFSKDLCVDLDMLEYTNLISRRNGIKLTKDGKDALQKCNEIFEENKVFLKYIDSVVDKYANLDTEEIMEATYETKVVIPRIRKLMRIGDIPEGQIILFKPSEKTMKRAFNINEGWLGSLELLLDKEATHSLMKAEEDVREGRVSKLSV